MLHRFAIVALFGAAGCQAYRPIAPIDDDERAELVRIRSTISDRPVAFVAGPHAKPDAVRRIEDAFRDQLAAACPAGDDSSALQIECDGPFRDSWNVADAEAETLFNVLSLGFWPQKRSDREEWRFHLVDPSGGDAEVSSETTRPAIVGWLGGPMSAWPGWSYGGAGAKWAPETDEERDNRRARTVFDLARAIDAFVHPK